MDDRIPGPLEERIAHYERPGNDPGPLAEVDWAVLVATGILLPVVCLVLGWFLGWPS